MLNFGAPLYLQRVRLNTVLWLMLCMIHCYKHLLQKLLHRHFSIPGNPPSLATEQVVGTGRLTTFYEQFVAE